MSDSLTLFVGPTAHGLDEAVLTDAGVTVRPPAGRGDVAALIDSACRPGRLAVADGTFHRFPAVGHAEIRTAIASGWEIWGLCSMGAIRGAEMHSLGMRGFGEVFEEYLRDPDLDDDEVALMHSSEAPFRPMSEPMLHIRRFISSLQERDLVTHDQAVEVVRVLKERWYADRTLGAVKEALVGLAGLSEAVVAAELANFDAYRVKQQDLTRFLKEKPWQPRA